MGDLQEILDELVSTYNRQEFIADDPIVIPHRFRNKKDIEISGFLTALISWGSRPAIIKSASYLIDLMDGEPYDFVKNHSRKDLKSFDKFVYRTMQPDDIKFIISSLQMVILKHGGLEELFSRGISDDDTDVYSSISKARSILVSIPHPVRSEKHLANPDTGSSAKRINMFLRWVVRNDLSGVDFGLWKCIRPDQLICPLDVHTGNAARAMGLITRKANDRKAAEELTSKLRKFDPADPVKYDFALFGYGKDFL